MVHRRSSFENRHALELIQIIKIAREKLDRRLKEVLLTGFAFFAVHHGFDAAGLLLFRGELLFIGFGDGGFFDVAGLAGSQVVGGFEAGVPGVAVHVAQGLHVGFGEEEVHALGLVDPLLASGGGVDDGFVADFEDGLVLLLEVVGDAFDIRELAVEVFELVDHVAVPEAFFFEVVDEDRVKDGEVATEVTLHKQVGVIRLNAWGGAHDVADGGGGSDGEDVGVAHAVLGDGLADGTPVHFAATGDFDFDSPFVFEGVDGVLREDAAIPFGTLVAVVGAALAG